MMADRPFLADCSKVYDETYFTSAPAQFGSQPLLVTYGNHRKIFDTAATSVIGNPYPNQTSPSPQYFQQLQHNILQPIKRSCPLGVSYRFENPGNATTVNNFRQLGINYNTPPPNFFAPPQQPIQPFQQSEPIQRQFEPFVSPNPCYNPRLTFDQQPTSNMNQFQKHAFEAMLLHEMMKKKNEFQLRCHRNEGTDTNDLPFRLKKELANEVYPAKESQSPSCVNVPEVLCSGAARRKKLLMSKTASPGKDEELQNVPESRSVETQYEKGCDCDEDTQTDRRVCFAAKCPKRHKGNRKNKGGRCVDDDSSESSER